MGPRSIERGNSGWERMTRSVCMLQWGRARLSAEMAVRAWVRAHGAPASMGPRSIERGNPAQRLQPCRARGSFNGAALD